MVDNIDLVNVPSGKISIHLKNGRVFLQFNCSCEDALPYCKANCCRNRPDYNVLLGKNEKSSFIHAIPHPAQRDLYILNHKNGHCMYLNEDYKCSVHSAKPNICKRWHCSPGGVGDNINLRDSGWLLLPGQGDMQHDELRNRILDEI
jgi:hypothetical protein